MIYMRQFLQPNKGVFHFLEITSQWPQFLGKGTLLNRLTNFCLHLILTCSPKQVLTNVVIISELQVKNHPHRLKL